MASAAAWIRIGVIGLLTAVPACNPAKPPAPPPATTLTPYPLVDWSAQDFSEHGDYGKRFASDYAATRAICAGVVHAEPPAADFPTAREQAALKDCESHALYYGIGIPADPVKARHCAMIERTARPASPYEFFAGDAMLAMVYANGRGVPRNYAVAIHMACRMQDAPFAMDSRIKWLAEQRRTGSTDDGFETCQHNTSGNGEGVCRHHAALLAEQARAARIARLKQGWAPGQRDLFDRVYASLTVYAGIAHDMDCHGGTAHGACTIEGQEADIERFLGRVEALAQGRPLPKDVPSEGPRPAIGGPRWAEWYQDESEREWLTGNREQAIAARRVFERDLIAFARSALPGLTPHQVRKLFANI